MLLSRAVFVSSPRQPTSPVEAMSTPQHGVGLLQAVERELAGLDAYVVEVEEVLAGLLHWHAEHHFRGQLDEVDFQHLADEWERARGAQVALYDLDIVVAGEELYVERAADVQLFGYLAAYALDAAYGLAVELLRGGTVWWRRLSVRRRTLCVRLWRRL